MTNNRSYRVVTSSNLHRPRSNDWITQIGTSDISIASLQAGQSFWAVVNEVPAPVEEKWKVQLHVLQVNHGVSYIRDSLQLDNGNHNNKKKRKRQRTQNLPTKNAYVVCRKPREWDGLLKAFIKYMNEDSDDDNDKNNDG